MIKVDQDSKGIFLNIISKKQIELRDMLEGINYLKEASHLPRKIRLLEDASLSTVMFSDDDIELLAKCMYEASKEFLLIKHAIILSEPNGTALAYLLKSYNYASNYHLQIFSKKESAMEWLNKDF